MTAHTLGILTGISYVSGLDYFKGINEIVLANTPKCHVMSPNPVIVMVSVDCDEYAHYLTLKSFDKVAEYLLTGVRKLVAAGCEMTFVRNSEDSRRDTTTTVAKSVLVVPRYQGPLAYPSFELCFSRTQPLIVPGASRGN